MSILDIFRSAPTEASAPAALPTTPLAAAPTDPTALPTAANPASQVTPVTDPNGLVPAQPASTEQNTEIPLDQFKDLWQDAPIDPNAPPEPTTPVALNPEDVQKAMAKVDFSSSVTADSLALITAGGEGALAAFAEVLNKVASQSMSQAVLVSDKLAQQTIEKALAAQAAALPTQIRAQQNSAHLLDTNPLFNNPAIRPVIEATQAQLEVKFPTATPAEITKMTQDYIVTMGESFAPKAAVAPGAAEVNWESFLAGS